MKEWQDKLANTQCKQCQILKPKHNIIVIVQGPTQDWHKSKTQHTMFNPVSNGNRQPKGYKTAMWNVETIHPSGCLSVGESERWVCLIGGSVVSLRREGSSDSPVLSLVSPREREKDRRVFLTDRCWEGGCGHRVSPPLLFRSLLLLHLFLGVLVGLAPPSLIPLYLIHSSSDGLSDSSFSLSSSSGRSPHSNKFKPVASSRLRVDTASLLNIQKWPLLQDSKQGLQGATTWYPTTLPHFRQAISLSLHLQLSVE